MSPNIIMTRDGQDHHFLVILKIKIRSSKNVILKIKDQITQACDLENQDRDDFEDQDHFTFRTQREVVLMMGGEL